MNKVNIPTELNLVSTAGKVYVINFLEYKRYTSRDEDYIKYCDYCLNIVRQGIEFHYYEVFDFLGLGEEVVPKEITVEVILFMDMFDHISSSLAELPYLEACDVEMEYYTKFCGFEAAAIHHLSYYIFLVRNNKQRVPIFGEALPLTVNHYREMLLRYEHHKRNTYLSGDMIMNICVRREQQIKFAL